MLGTSESQSMSPQTFIDELKQLFLKIKHANLTYDFHQVRNAFEIEVDRLGENERYEELAKKRLCLFLNYEPSSSTRQSRTFTEVKTPEEIRDGILRTFFSFNMIMPNGKKLHECTFAECGSWGAQLMKLARHGKANGWSDDKIEDHFDEISFEEFIR